MRITGRYETIGDTRYFIPDPLPPHDPPLLLDAETIALYGEAMLELGKINEMTTRLPDIERFIKAYVIKEAVLSSSIEGIHTTLLDVFTQPLVEAKPSKNTQIVMNYTKALSVALTMIKEGFPITSRVILKAHEALMRTGEGDKSDPGRYRRQSVKVGNLIPPLPPLVPELMSQLEQYINAEDTLPPLIKAGLVHVQFEEIHPFLDGNGRIGRLLIVLMLVEKGILVEPMLYPSYYFRKHQSEYYQWLDRVRTHGDFEGWIKFYLTAMRDSTIDAYRRAKDIEALGEELRQIILDQKQFSVKMCQTRLRALAIIFSYPVISVNALSKQLGVSYNTANQVISDFIKLGFLVKETQQKRGRLFTFKQYLEVLERDYK
jgi:Fic family protein